MSPSFVILSFYLVLCCISSNAGENTRCPSSFSEFVSCIHERLESNEKQNSNLRILRNDVQAEVNHCFNNNDCEQPDYDHDPCKDLPQPIRSFVDKVRQEIGDAPEPVGHCLQAKFARSTDECVASVGLGHLVSNTSTSKVRTSNSDFGHQSNGFFFGDGNSTDRRKANVILVNIATAVRRCHEKKPNETKQTRLLQCLFNAAMSDGRRSMCQAANVCDNGAPSDCRRLHRQEVRVICVCRRGKQREVLNKLDELRKHESVAVLDIVAALGSGKRPEEISSDIRSCYTSHGYPPPPTLTLLDQFIAMQQVKQQTDKPGSSQMRVDQRTLTVIRDLYNSGDFGDDECKTCE